MKSAHDQNQQTYIPDILLRICLAKAVISVIAFEIGFGQDEGISAEEWSMGTSSSIKVRWKSMIFVVCQRMFWIDFISL